MPADLGRSERAGFGDAIPLPTDLVKLLEYRWFGVASSIATDVQPEQPALIPRSKELSTQGEQADQYCSNISSMHSQTTVKRRAFQGSTRVGSQFASQLQSRYTTFPHTPDKVGFFEQHRQPPITSTGSQNQDGSTTLKAASVQPELDTEDQVPLPLGTWANRQRVFFQQQAASTYKLDKDSTKTVPHSRIEEVGDQASASSHAAVVAHCAPFRHAGQQLPKQFVQVVKEHEELQNHAVIRPQQSTCSSQDEEEINAAWRWRFARKWQTEQAKQFDPEYGKEGGDDEWGDALGYMDVLATHGLNLQIARTMSLDQFASLSMLSSTLSQSMMLDSSMKESPLTSTMEDGSLNATQHIVAVARRAQQLLKQQQEIERQVEERWECASSGQPWVGQHLPAVTIDSWGRFAFVLVRLLDRSSRHKVVVRGRNGSDDGALWTQLEQEVSHVAGQYCLPGPRLELLGNGIMEWSRERDRTLNIVAGNLHACTDAGLKSKSDVSRLAGALVQSSLPMTYKILVDGQIS